mgnify:CR=1 FL=1
MFSLAEYLLLDVHVGIGKQLGIAVMTLRDISYLRNQGKERALVLINAFTRYYPIKI